MLSKLRPGDEKSFWLSSRKPHRGIKPQTMCGWLKEVINLSGALAGSAKDIRAAGASTAVQANVEMSQVLRAGDWQRVSTLKKFYFKPQKINMLSNILGCASSAP